MRIEVEINEDILHQKAEKEVEKKIVSEIIDRIAGELRGELLDNLGRLIWQECQSKIGDIVRDSVQRQLSSYYIWRFCRAVEKIADNDSEIQNLLCDDYRKQIAECFNYINEEDKQELILEKTADKIARRCLGNQRLRSELAKNIVELCKKEGEHYETSGL